MAGRPLRNAMIDALRQRASEWFGDDLHTALDYAVEWVENGRTLQHMIYDLTRAIDEGTHEGGYELPTPTPMLSRTMLMNYLESLDPASGTVAIRLSRARSIGAHAMVEQGNVALDADDAHKLDRDTLNVLDRRLAAKERLAAAWNRNDFGKAAAAIVFNVADLHLAALQSQARVVVAAGGGLVGQGGNEPDWHVADMPRLSGSESLVEPGEKTDDVAVEAEEQTATVGKKP